MLLVPALVEIRHHRWHAASRERVERLSLAHDGCDARGGGDCHLAWSELAAHAVGDLLEEEGFAHAADAGEEGVLAGEAEVQDLLLFGVEGGCGCGGVERGALALGLLQCGLKKMEGVFVNLKRRANFFVLFFKCVV